MITYDFPDCPNEIEILDEIYKCILRAGHSGKCQSIVCWRGNCYKNNHDWHVNEYNEHYLVCGWCGAEVKREDESL